jgi:calcineurin-like phosphoesterase family protein
VLVGAGDIASCSAQGDEATARLLDGLVNGSLPVIVFTTGDNAYGDGTASEFAQCYDPTWGRHKARTRPAPGNHDYHGSGASGYFGYFGAAAGPAPGGYYSFDAGDWHVVVLNSNIAMAAGSDQERWLRADLAASGTQCTLAIWHHPRFTSGTKHGSNAAVGPLWDALYAAGADVVINGHEHSYERLAPQTPAGVADPARGLREFIVGTGGEGLSSFGTPLPTSEVRNGATFGVLMLTLEAREYSWEFVPVAGATFTDSGSGSCH